jgi:hypothetical protein
VRATTWKIVAGGRGAKQGWLDIGRCSKFVYRVMRLMILLLSLGFIGSLQLRAVDASAISATSSGAVTIQRTTNSNMVTMTCSGITILEHRWMSGNHTNGFGLEQYRMLQGSNSVTLLLSGKDIRVTSPGGDKFVRYTDLVFGSHRLKLRLPATGVAALGGFLVLMAGWAVGMVIYELTAKPRRSEKGAA